MGWDRSDTATLVSAVTGGATCCGALLLVGSYMLFPDLRTLSRRMIAVLSICDLLQGVFFVLVYVPVGSDTLGCELLAALGVFAAVSSFIWTACIAYFVYRVIVYPLLDHSHLEPFFHCIGWGYPALFLIVMFSVRPHIASRDDDVPWCFIAMHHPWWRLSSVYIPLCIAWLLTFVWYFLAQRRLGLLGSTTRGEGGMGQFSRAVGAKAEQSVAGPARSSSPGLVSDVEVKFVQQKLLAIPLIFFLSRVWGLVYRLIEMAKNFSAPSSMDSFYWLELLTAFGDPAQGIFNALIFVVLTKKVRRRYDASDEEFEYFVPVSYVEDEDEDDLSEEQEETGQAQRQAPEHEYAEQNHTHGKRSRRHRGVARHSRVRGERRQQQPHSYGAVRGAERARHSRHSSDSDDDYTDGVQRGDSTGPDNPLARAVSGARRSTLSDYEHVVSS